MHFSAGVKTHCQNAATRSYSLDKSGTASRPSISITFFPTGFDNSRKQQSQGFWTTPGLNQASDLRQQVGKTLETVPISLSVEHRTKAPARSPQCWASRDTRVTASTARTCPWNHIFDRRPSLISEFQRQPWEWAKVDWPSADLYCRTSRRTRQVPGGLHFGGGTDIPSTCHVSNVM